MTFEQLIDFYTELIKQKELDKWFHIEKPQKKTNKK